MNRYLITIACLVAASCTNKEIRSESNGNLVNNQSKSTSTSLETATTCCWIAVTNQATDQIEAYDPAVYDWNTASALKWTFKPTSARGYSSFEMSLWSNPSDVKVRYAPTGVPVFGTSTQAIVTIGNRLATIADYPSGNKIWTGDAQTGSNPHAIELLPDGNVVIAASDSGWVRIFSSSQPPPNHAYYYTFHLTQAHAALYDPSINRIWTVGYDGSKPVGQQHVLIALQVGGTLANPTLSEDVSRRSILPGSWGHDVYAYYGDTNKLWVSMNTDSTGTKGVAIYDKTTKSFTWQVGAANRTFVKSIGNQPGANQVVETKPSVCPDGWNTNEVDFYSLSTGALVATRSKTGACWYKARVFNQQYQ